MPVGDFVGKNQRELKTCVSCRDSVKAYKLYNKDMINDNNAFHSSKRAHAAAIERAKKPRILARPVDSNGEEDAASRNNKIEPKFISTKHKKAET